MYKMMPFLQADSDFSGVSRSSLHEWSWGTRPGRSPAPSSHRGPSGSWPLHGTLGRIQPLPVQGSRGVSKDSPRHGQVGSLKAERLHFNSIPLTKFWLLTTPETSGAINDQNVVLPLRISPPNLLTRWSVKKLLWCTSHFLHSSRWDDKSSPLSKSV